MNYLEMQRHFFEIQKYHFKKVSINLRLLSEFPIYNEVPLYFSTLAEMALQTFYY